MRDGPKNGCYHLAGILPSLLPLVWRYIDQSGVRLEVHLRWEMQDDDDERWERKGKEKALPQPRTAQPDYSWLITTPIVH